MGKDSGDMMDILDSNEVAIQDDTLTRKLPSITFEKFLKETNRAKVLNNENKYHIIDDSNNSEGFELNFDGGSNALSKFQNPFDESPNNTNELKKNTQFCNDKSEIDNSLLFRTPSKINNLITRSTPNRVNNKILKIKRSTSTNAVNEFRALKEKQTNIAGFGFNSFDESNIGLVVDVRKPIDDNIEENSMDDSSVRLNLLPSAKTFKNKEEKEIIEATQIDGNIHQEVNKLLIEQSLKFTNDNEDEIYLLKKFDYSSNETEFNRDKLDKKINFDKHVETCINNEKNISDSDTSKLEISIKDTLNIRDKDSQNLNDEIDSETQSQPKVLFKHVDSFISETNSVSNKSRDEILSNKEQEDIEKQLKETQIIDNFSQSLVLDEDENNELNEKNNDSNNEDEEYDEDKIKIGRNILQTFRIEDESHSQNELRTPFQTQLETQNSNQTPNKSQMQIKSSENEPINDEIEIQGSEANLSFRILDRNQLFLPETLKIDEENEKQSLLVEKQSDINLKLQASSPVNLFPNDNTDNTESEIPNTSAVSISKIFVEGKNSDNNNNIIGNEQEEENNTSTPIIRKPINNNFIKSIQEIDEIKDNNSSKMIEKLNNVLREEKEDEINKESDESNNVIRKCKSKQYQITDVLDFNCVFIIDSNGRIPGRITKMVESDNTIFVNIKIREGDVIIEHSKIYAPICFDIGDPVKYIFDKRNNYIVTGLKKNDNEIDNINDKIETIDGFNKLLIKKKLKKNKEENQEIEVELKDIYLTGAMCRNYKYKLFNDLNDFQKYLDYQIRQFNLNDENNDKYSYELNADDTLINLLPISRSRSLINNKNKGYFYRCLFIITGLNNNNNNNNNKNNFNKNESKNNTPRHNKEKKNINQLIEFIQLQGGTVLKESGFEDIIKFKLKDKWNNNFTNNINKNNKSNNNSPRRNKVNNNNNLFEDNELNTENNNFINYKCLKDRGDYYIIKFKSENNGTNNEEIEFDNSIEIDNEISKFEFGCVISSRHVRTLKYLECLCLKWPIIHIEFIRKCFNDNNFLKNWREEWTKFLLISGECSLLNSCCIGLDIFEYYNKWRNGYKLDKQLKLNKLFKGEKIIIINFNFRIFKERFQDVINMDHYHKRSKRRKIETGLEQNFKKMKEAEKNDKDRTNGETENEDDDQEEEEEKEEETEDDDDNNKKTIDGPVKEETLIWIFRQIGFDEVILIKDHCNLRELIKFGKKGNDNINNENYIYIKYGNDIERFKKVIETENGARGDKGAKGVNNVNKIINWEWLVQRIICNYI